MCLDRYDTVRLLLELPPDAFMTALKSNPSVRQQTLSAEVTFFVVEKLDVIARCRGDYPHSAGRVSASSALGLEWFEGHGATGSDDSDSESAGANRAPQGDEASTSTDRRGGCKSHASF